MKTTSRKRLLVSSVAMLLVAMLALGTATYAWFTTDSSAYADGISVQTVKASELKLSAATGDWTDHLQYGYAGKILKPASSADGVNWFKATAAGKSAYTADADSVMSAGTYVEANQGIDNYVFMQQLNVANFGGSDVQKAKLEFTLSETQVQTGKKYLRLALVPVSSRATSAALPTMDETGKNSFAENVYSVGTDSAEAYKTTSTTATITSKDASTKVTIDLGTLKAAENSTTPSANGVKYFNLFIWFEGQDVDCYDTNAGNELPTITFNVSGETADMN